MSTRPIRVLCVDDNKLVAEAVERCLMHEPRFEWAGWLSNVDDLAEHIEANPPDVVLLDIDMPGRDPFELLEDLAQRNPQVRVLMFSGHVRGDYIDRAIDSGAWGYLSKNEGIDDMLRAIEQVAAGEFAITGEALQEHGRGVARRTSEESFG